MLGNLRTGVYYRSASKENANKGYRDKTIYKDQGRKSLLTILLKYSII